MLKLVKPLKWAGKSEVNWLKDKYKAVKFFRSTNKELGRQIKLLKFKYKFCKDDKPENVWESMLVNSLCLRSIVLGDSFPAK